MEVWQSMNWLTSPRKRKRLCSIGIRLGVCACKLQAVSDCWSVLGIPWLLWLTTGPGIVVASWLPRCLLATQTHHLQFACMASMWRVKKAIKEFLNFIQFYGSSQTINTHQSYLKSRPFPKSVKISITAITFSINEIATVWVPRKKCWHNIIHVYHVIIIPIRIIKII